MNALSQHADRYELVAVYEWLARDGTMIGLGTALEFEHWKAEGVQSPDDRLGNVLSYEHPDMDARRSIMWAAEIAS